MERKIAFTDETREQIVTEQQSQGFRLYEEQRHLDGWWLLFTDEPSIEPEPPEPVRNYGKEIDELKAEIEKLKRRHNGT